MRLLLKILIAIPLLPLALLLLLAWLLGSLILHLLVWLCWCTRGKHLLLITSNSPHWHDYIQTNIVSQLPQQTVVLNWSERKRWKPFSLAVLLFNHFGGNREFNPIVVAFRPFRTTKVFRFWKPFKDYRRGIPGPLEDLEREMFAFLESSGIVRSQMSD